MSSANADDQGEFYNGKTGPHTRPSDRDWTEGFSGDIQTNDWSVSPVHSFTGPEVGTLPINRPGATPAPSS